MRTAVKGLAVLAAATCLALVGAGVAQADIYWANVGTDTIGHATVSGDTVEPSWLSTGGASGGGVAADDTYVYWTQWTGAIGRAKLDGTSADPNFISGLNHTPTAIAVDAGHLYWAQPNDAAIGRANIDGTGVDESFIDTDAGSGSSPDGVAASGGFVYWADANLGTIGRANADGSGADGAFISGLNTPRSVTTDGTWLYWGDTGAQAIGRAQVDGTSVDPHWRDFGTAVYGTAAVGAYVYWSEPFFNQIGHIYPDSSTGEYIIDGADFPEQIAVVTAGVVVSGSGAFGNVNVGSTASQTYTVTNTGNAPLVFGATTMRFSGVDSNQYSVTADSCLGQTIVVGGTCTVTVRFAPTSTGSKDVVAGIIGNADAAGYVALTGSGRAATFSASPLSKDFGGVRVGSTSTSQTFTISNTASGGTAGAMTIPAAGVTLTGTDPTQFAIGTDTCSGTTVAAGSSCSVAVTFSPGSTGAKSASLRFADDATGNPHTVALSGTGTAPAFGVSPTAKDFGGVRVSTTSTSQTFTVTNTSSGAASAPLAIATASITGGSGQFAIESDGCSGQTVAAGATCEVDVSFTPASTGAKSATLTFADDAADSPQTVALSGTGTVSAFDVSPSPWSFGDVRTGQASPAQTLTVTNTSSGATGADVTFGAGAVTLTGADPGQFAITADGCSSQAVAPGATCTVDVRFAPTATGAQTATLRFADDAPGSPQTVALDGVGTQPVLGVSPLAQDFETVWLNQAAPGQTFTLTNSGTGPSVLGAVALVGGGAGQFTISADTCSGTTLGAGASCTVLATFTPTAPGAQAATLEFPNDTGAPVTASLGGFGFFLVPPTPTPGDGPSGGGGGGGGGGTSGTPSTTAGTSTTSAGNASDRMSVGLLGARLTVSRRGTISLRLRCEGSALPRCAGTLQVLRHAARVTAAPRVRYRIGAGDTKRVVVRLRSGVRPLLAGSCTRRSATVRILVTQVGGAATGADRRIALRRSGCH